jgi:hypothetical protein
LCGGEAGEGERGFWEVVERGFGVVRGERKDIWRCILNCEFTCLYQLHALKKEVQGLRSPINFSVGQKETCDIGSAKRYQQFIARYSFTYTVPYMEQRTSKRSKINV